MFCGFVEVRRPVGAAVHAERGVLLRRQRRFVDGERREERDLVGEAGLPILLDEIDAHAAGQEGEDGVGICRGNARELGRIIELAERHIHLVENFAGELVFETRGGIFAGLIVRHDDNDFLHAGGLGVLAEHFVHLVVLIGGDEQVRVALLAGEGRGAGIRADEE